MDSNTLEKPQNAVGTRYLKRRRWAEFSLEPNHGMMALGVLFYIHTFLKQGRLTDGALGAARIFWYFVVGLWPVLYVTVYLLYNGEGNMIRPGKRTLTATIALLLLLQTAASALACPVCFSANKKSRTAFLLTTGLLSTMPWVIIGGGVFWYRRRLRQLDQQTEEENSSSNQDSPSG